MKNSGSRKVKKEIKSKFELKSIKIEMNIQAQT